MYNVNIRINSISILYPFKDGEFEAKVQHLKEHRSDVEVSRETIGKKLME